MTRLVNAGVDARLDEDTDEKVHAKLLVADDDVALVGSTNWSASAIDANRECNLLLTGGATPEYLAAWHDDLWDRPGVRTPPDVEQPDDAVTIALTDDALLPALLASIGAAEERIDFTLYATFLQPTNLDAPAMQVFGALGDAASRGVDVRGVADWSDWNSGNNDSNDEAVDWLEARGVRMRWDEPGVNMHAKAWLMDDVVQIQTANVSSSGFLYNREAGATTTDAEVVEDLAGWFQGLWDESTEQPP